MNISNMEPVADSSGTANNLETVGAPSESCKFFPLFHLPNELRNRIFEMALTDLRGLKCIYRTRTMIKKGHKGGKTVLYKAAIIARSYQNQKGNWADFNQLKYVCRQLYKETAGYEIRFNDILFQRSEKTTALKKLETFIGGCTNKTFGWLRRVTLHPVGELPH